MGVFQEVSRRALARNRVPMKVRKKVLQVPCLCRGVAKEMGTWSTFFGTLIRTMFRPGTFGSTFLGYFSCERSRPLHTGVKNPKSGGSKTQNREKRVSESKIPFLYTAPQGKSGFFDSKHPFLR